MAIIIRDYQDTDAEFLMRAIYDMLTLHEKESCIAASQNNAVSIFQSFDKSMSIVAERNGIPVGIICLGRPQLECTREIAIAPLIYVVKHLRRGMVSWMLFREARARLKAAGVERVYHTISDSNIPAKNFCKAAGFVPFATHGVLEL